MATDSRGWLGQTRPRGRAGGSTDHGPVRTWLHPRGEPKVGPRMRSREGVPQVVLVHRPMVTDVPMALSRSISVREAFERTKSTTRDRAATCSASSGWPQARPTRISGKTAMTLTDPGVIPGGALLARIRPRRGP